MKLLVGLGNPGAKYAANRHNVGFMAVDAIADGHGFGPWRSKFNGVISEGRLGGEKVLLQKPETYMNLSGDAVQAAMKFYKLELGDVIVFHDELDLAPGKLRIKTGGGHAGHNGLRSIDAHLGPGFSRVRIGIGHPGDKRLVSNYVLGDFSKYDNDWLEPMLDGISEGADDLVRGDNSGFMNAVARRLAPNKPQKQAKAPEAKPAKKPAPVAEPEPEPLDERTMLQKLADRFR
ncbi:aminoacyl-tRNA hydrolase [Amaricoccus tamworthensis]|uniref:aminoacyl-tRNA hydrolase n=1 Tax=Amaricoccus tamworthensis TaxID=57002 RepID=UPI003C7D9D91